MDKQYYEEYYDLERNHWWFRARKKIIHSLLKKYIGRQNASVLNIGAATGETSRMLGDFGNVTSVEYDKDCCVFVKQKMDLDFIQASITELPFPGNSFDVVSAFDVVEHVEQDAQAVKEIFRVCRPGGCIAVTVPAYRFLWSYHDDVNHHVRRYSLEELKNLFKDLDGKIIYSSYFNTFLFPPVALTRMIANVFPSAVKRKGSGSDFSYSGGWISSSLFYPVMAGESFFMKAGIRFPFGISIVLIFTKGSDT